MDNAWTLFLDRDGVLNERILADYVRTPAQFRWLPGVLPALRFLTGRFGLIVIVTNQQGVGKGLMTEADLDVIHSKLRQQATYAGAQIDAIYACTKLAVEDPPCRKPRPGMAEQARREFPRIDFARSVMVGDTASDMGFGRSVGMHTVLVGGAKNVEADERYATLWDYAVSLGA